MRFFFLLYLFFFSSFSIAQLPNFYFDKNRCQKEQINLSISVLPYHLNLDSIFQFDKAQKKCTYQLFIIEDQEAKSILQSSILQQSTIQLDSIGNYQLLIYDRVAPILIEILITPHKIQLNRFYHCACH